MTGFKDLKPAIRNAQSALKILLFTLIVTVPLLLSCQTQLDPVTPGSDAAEYESVWQFLRAYSIYQDRIPSNPFAFASPSGIMDAINDTLKGFSYTGYVSPSQGASDTIWDVNNAWIQPVASAGGGAASDDSLVFLDTLTRSTAILTIYTFEAWQDGEIYNDFLQFVPELQGFKNIIIDLRGNTGGYIDDADSIISAMVPPGTNYIKARQRDYNALTGQFVTRDWHNWTTTGPQLLAGKHYAVVMDGWTASASELCLNGLYEGQRNEWGSSYSMPLLGSKSYGKGIGQVIIERRRAYTGSNPGFDTFYNQAGDSMMVIPITVTNYLQLRITFLQLRGVSDRMGVNGVYHDIGIPADIVQPSIKDSVDNAMNRWLPDSIQQVMAPIMYAEEILEPSVNLDSLMNPNVATLLEKKVTRPFAKRVGRPSVRAVVEKVITTDKVFPLKGKL